MDSSAGYDGIYSSYAFDDTTAYQGYSTPSQVLGSREFPVDLNNACATSRLSSTGLSSHQDVESQSYFQRSRKEFIDPPVSNRENVTQPNWNPNWTGGIALGVPSFVPLSLISPCALATEEDLNVIERQPVYPTGSSSAYNGEKSPEITFNSTGGWSNKSRRHSSNSHSKSVKLSSRSKGKYQTRQTKSSISSSKSQGHQLRSTRAGNKINYSEEDEETETISNTKTSHNMVEKQYRNRLNGQYSTLLGVLPSDLVGAEVEGYSRDSANAEKKVSKAEVLILARRRIEHLEREKRELEGGRNALLQDVQRLKGNWVGLGGQLMP